MAMKSKYSNRKTPEEAYALWHDDSGNRRCCTCNAYKPLDEFHKDKKGPSGRAFSCKECAIARSKESHRRRMLHDAAYKKAKRDSYVKATWGMSADQYEAAWRSQKLCAICKCVLIGGSQTHLDHSHSSGNKRKFLCTNCNRGLGHFKDNKDILMNAINYLNEHSKEVAVHE